MLLHRRFTRKNVLKCIKNVYVNFDFWQTTCRWINYGISQSHLYVCVRALVCVCVCVCVCVSVWVSELTADIHINKKWINRRVYQRTLSFRHLLYANICQILERCNVCFRSDFLFIYLWWSRDCLLLANLWKDINNPKRANTTCFSQRKDKTNEIVTLENGFCHACHTGQIVMNTTIDPEKYFKTYN